RCPGPGRAGHHGLQREAARPLPARRNAAIHRACRKEHGVRRRKAWPPQEAQARPLQGQHLGYEQQRPHQLQDAAVHDSPLVGARFRKMAEEPDIVIENRKELTYLLCQAAELEHGLMCQYLYAAFSLKTTPGPGLPETHLVAVERWRRTLLEVAGEEMLH